MSWYGDIGQGTLDVGTLGLADPGVQSSLGGMFGVGSGDPSNPYRNALSSFGAQAATGYQQGQTGLNNTANYLQGQMQGQNSVSALQLQQSLQQNQAVQQSMAASASPQNAAMAARNMALQSGQLGAGLAGQQATAGLQERNQAAQSLGQLQLGQSGQNMQGALGAYGAALQNPQATWGSLIGPMVGGAAAAAMKGH